jgi:endonuclease YncB( thermonuclease family)
VDIDLGFGIWLQDKHIRVYGVNAPEKNTVEGIKAKDFTGEFMSNDSAIYTLNVLDHKADKYGRILAGIKRKDGSSTIELAESLISAGQGKPYFGGKKDV